MKRIRRIFSIFFEKIGSLFYFLSRKIYQTDQDRRTILWYKNPNEKDVRLVFDLRHDSLVFDVGGYQGQWASDVYSMYSCNIFIFEPISDFVFNIRKRFLNNSKIKVFDFGLSSKTENRDMFLEGDKTSSHRGVKKVGVKVIDVVEFIKNSKISKIDLIKINIEGDEFDLLERLIETGNIKNIRYILVQFHDFVSDAFIKMNNLRNKLLKTHNLVYGQDFVWERWEIK